MYATYEISSRLLLLGVATVEQIAPLAYPIPNHPQFSYNSFIYKLSIMILIVRKIPLPEC